MDCYRYMENSELETQIMKALLTGNDPVLNTLREQFYNSKIVKREFTGCGFFIHFSVLESCKKVNPQNFVIDDVYLEVEGAENGASAMLFIREGIIDFLEVVTCTGNWPGNPILKSLNYFTKKPRADSVAELVPSKERDIKVTKLAWTKMKKQGKL